MTSRGLLTSGISLLWALACTNPLGSDVVVGEDTNPVTFPDAPPRPDALVRLQVDHGDVTRSVWLHVPETNIALPMPLFVVLGPHSDGRRIADEFSAQFDGDALFVFPDGMDADSAPEPADAPPTDRETGKGKGKGGKKGKGKAGKKGKASKKGERPTPWYPSGTIEGDRDVAFVKSVAAVVSGSHKVDPDQIYAVGHWTGGTLALQLGCGASDVFDGVVAVSAAMARDAPTCRPIGPVRMLIVAGTEDPRVLWTGSEPFLGVMESVGHWLDPNECDPDSHTERLLDDIDLEDGVRIKQHDWSCAGAPVRLLELSGAGGGWPGRDPKSPKGDNVPRDIDGAAVAVDFLMSDPEG